MNAAENFLRWGFRCQKHLLALSHCCFKEACQVKEPTLRNRRRASRQNEGRWLTPAALGIASAAQWRTTNQRQVRGGYSISAWRIMR